MLMSASPEARACSPPATPGRLRYSTTVNPSARSNSSAANWGARQMAPGLTSRMRVVSGGSSAKASRARAPASPAAASPPMKRRRVIMPSTPF